MLRACRVHPGYTRHKGRRRIPPLRSSQELEAEVGVSVSTNDQDNHEGRKRDTNQSPQGEESDM
jgi:hypothetical protein